MLKNKFLFPGAIVTKKVSGKLVDVNIQMVKPGNSSVFEITDKNVVDFDQNTNAICDGTRLYLAINENSKMRTILLSFIASVILFVLFQKYQFDLTAQFLTFFGIGAVIVMNGMFAIMKKIVVFDSKSKLVYFPPTFSQPAVTVEYEDIFFRAGKHSAYLVSKKSMTKTGKWVQIPFFLNKDMKTELHIIIKILDMFMKSPDSIRNLNNNLSKQINWFDSLGTTIAELTKKHSILTIENEKEFRIIEAIL